MGKIRCPLRPPSMTRDRGRPEILQPPEHPQACCTQQTITVPPDVLAKTAQKHDYPSKAHRRSYARRTGAERGFATAKDRATNDISRGWCRLMGLTPLMLFTTTLLIVRNQRILQHGTPGKPKTSAGQPPGCPENPQPPPQDPRQPRRPAITRPAHRATAPPLTSPPPAGPARPRPASKPIRSHPRATEDRKTRSAQAIRPDTQNVRPKREHDPH